MQNMNIFGTTAEEDLSLDWKTKMFKIYLRNVFIRLKYSILFSLLDCQLAVENCRAFSPNLEKW